ncbi:hypothetical protein BGZ61DRAFT_527805 [Ilyonectria robusta]|uniref:uncharacterized protein n=1 Tax=Ilyonectria robusta TaxID=1079257 RepID=UPI001E8EAA81|nr:uncharacterized protein BGZ61DRAFT_527805 [Ilyonectria robusta]KAH8734462.1 hypothetical protein BGZ61DRAFT_527805 [Ilyonectria robusta]
MATDKKREWLCILPDKANVLERRKEVKSQHYEAVKPLVASGKLVAGGAMFEKHPVDGEPALFKGSVIVYTGDSAEEVHKLITNDAYARGGVWDLEKAQIIPVITFYALPLPHSQVY